MRAIIAAAFLAALLAPAGAVPADFAPATASRDRPIVLAVNPQPEPPGRAKVKRIDTGGPDSRRNKKIKPPAAPATKY